ncbi:MAG: hypothetical protein M1816_006093 [Peltula sp. TS41687]|nr:MAG: hypothetical protein M1816_006093 [Peltula sp. TS41687]
MANQSKLMGENTEKRVIDRAVPCVRCVKSLAETKTGILYCHINYEHNDGNKCLRCVSLGKDCLDVPEDLVSTVLTIKRDARNAIEMWFGDDGRGLAIEAITERADMFKRRIEEGRSKRKRQAEEISGDKPGSKSGTSVAQPERPAKKAAVSNATTARQTVAATSVRPERPTTTTAVPGNTRAVFDPALAPNVPPSSSDIPPSRILLADILRSFEAQRAIMLGLLRSMEVQTVTTRALLYEAQRGNFMLSRLYAGHPVHQAAVNQAAHGRAQPR